MEAQRQRRADLAARINAWRKERLQIAGEWVFRNLWRALKWIVRFLISFGWLLFELFLPVVLGVAALVEVITSTGSALPVVMIGTIVLIHFWLIIGVFFAKHLTSVQNVGLGNPGNSEQTGDEQISAGSDAESVQRNWRDLFCRILSDVGRWIGQHLSLLYRLVRPFRVTGAFVWRWFAADYAI